eukprot:TRINITY_DN30877_c0_g1_i1.p1 TRINITY_DN30877_c0_g1~~TRINITY_DN30877_c0_g1_i1.p1  ORF type:complete len:102 (+),score=9.10 TRINITY_DN30877_c0_g1_i1:69-374(+)
MLVVSVKILLTGIEIMFFIVPLLATPKGAILCWVCNTRADALTPVPVLIWLWDSIGQCKTACRLPLLCPLIVLLKLSLWNIDSGLSCIMFKVVCLALSRTF